MSPERRYLDLRDLDLDDSAELYMKKQLMQESKLDANDIDRFKRYGLGRPFGEKFKRKTVQYRRSDLPIAWLMQALWDETDLLDEEMVSIFKTLKPEDIAREFAERPFPQFLQYLRKHGADVKPTPCIDKLFGGSPRKGPTKQRE